MFNLNKILPKALRYRYDDFDGSIKYVKDSAFIAFWESFLGYTKLRPDRRKRAFGRIHSNLFYYITGPMIIIALLVLFTVISGFSGLVVYFETNVYLNGIIISLMIFGILKSFHNAFLLFKTARFFRLIEDVIRKETIIDEDIYSLRRGLERDGKMVNTVAMVETIDNIERFGHPNFNDHRARLIKSKLGFRVGKNKANVSYISGILVMLGLLGTFLGLLATIDAVGSALNSMSNIGGESGEVGVEEMTGFIGSLAAPLQGMGLAFSSSLFGLSGSLLIGFFLYLVGTPQNAFMENVSRWIDDRIPAFNPDQKGKPQAKPKEDDIKDWLAGFIHMSVKTNRSISNLCKEVAKSTQETQRVLEGTHAIHETQKLLISSINEGNAVLKNIDDKNSRVVEVMPNLLRVSEAGLEGISTISQTMPSVVETAQMSLKNIMDVRQSSLVASENLPQIKDSIAEVSGNMTSIYSSLTGIVSNTSSVSTGVLDLATKTDEMSGYLEKTMQQSQRYITNFDSAQSRNEEVLGLIKEIGEQSNSIQHQVLAKSQENTEKMLQVVQLTQDNLSSIVENLEKISVNVSGDKNAEYLKEIEQSLSNLNSAHVEVASETKALLQRLESDPYVKQTQSLVEQLESVLNDLNSKIKKFISKSK